MGGNVLLNIVFKQYELHTWRGKLWYVFPTDISAECASDVSTSKMCKM